MVMFVVFPFIGALLALLAESYSIAPGYIIVVLLPFVIYFLFVSVKWSYASCPMCQQPMFHKYYFFYGFFRCVHCGYNLKDTKTSSNHGS